MTPPPRDIDAKLNALDCIYRIYERFVQSLDTACRKHCAECCTCNVTLTTLEGYRLVTGLEPDRGAALRERLEGADNPKRFRPQLTVNAIAERCIQGREVGEETADPSWGRCPLLDADLCTVYSVRPFGCRCFVSRQPCRRHGSADVDEPVLAVNHAFLQVVEHLDAGGCSGNLTDVLRVLAEEEGRQQYRRGALHCAHRGLARNRPITALMVPPEHRRRLAPILAALQGCFPH